jgi:transglutaminase-like putative cysteine protease
MNILRSWQLGFWLLAVPAIFAAVAHAATPVFPDWVVQASSPIVLPHGEREAKAAYLLEDTLLTVQPDGHAVIRYRAVVKILRPQGRRYALPYAAFSNDEKLLSFHVWSIGADGHQYTMKDNEYREEGNEEYGILYNDERVKVASPPGADPGGIVAWEVVEQFPWYRNEDMWGFQNSVPTVRSVYEIDLPPGWHKRAIWFRHEAAQPVEVAPGHFRWEMKDIPSIDLSDTPLAPSERALAGRASIYFASAEIPEGDALWAQIGNWYQGLAAPRSESAADVATTARSLGAGSADFMDRIAKVADFMQQKIRYVGIEIGIGGLQPHSAEDVFKNQYGDCKDKATLLISMLDALGVRATWVMVDTHRGFVDPGTPSSFGNHMIAAIEIPKGYENPRLQAVVTAKTGKKYLIFDPTNPYVSIGQLPDYLQGGYGTLVAGPESQVIELPVLKPDLDVIDRSAKFDLAADGTLKGDVTVTHSGPSSSNLRGRLTMSSDKEKQESLEQSLRGDFSAFTVADEKIANIRELDKQLVLQYGVTAPSYAKTAGSLLLVRPRIIGTDAERLNDKPRVYPVSFHSLGTWRDSFDVKIPGGYMVDEVPDPVNVDMGFATYRSEVKAQGDTLHYSREYVLKKLSLDPEQYGKLQDLEGKITADENSNAVLKKNQ